jgi:nitrogen fixation/metabolism regulation signal transduction histidine kinase
MKPRRRRPRRRLGFERRILLQALLTGLPAALVALILLWSGDFTPKVRWTLSLFIVGLGLGFAFHLRRSVVYPLRTLSNVVGALREGDFSLRARGARLDDALGEVVIEVNSLTKMLRDQRLDALEATALLRKIMTEIDVAVFAFDADRTLRLVNRAGERLLARPAERLEGHKAGDLDVDDLITGESPQVFDRSFPGGAGRWEARRSAFRQGGLPLQLLVITDLSRALRQEERQAWQRLIRVLGHEMNNSLAPIRSIVASLESLLTRQPRPDDWEEDIRRGLTVIGTRSASLNRFMEAYARLARLPEPKMEPLDLGVLVRRVVGLETRLQVTLVPGTALTVRADGDQIEQLLINLLRNAVEAALETGGGVRLGWNRNKAHIDLWIEDDGPGLPRTSNLFVPFFTTKPGGSGIGLVLSRQIAEAHGGSLTVENREPGPGCAARLRLPL